VNADEIQLDDALSGTFVALEIASSSDTAIHRLVRAGEVALGGLVDGYTYYISGATTNSFKLRTRPSSITGSIVDLVGTITVPAGVDYDGPFPPPDGTVVDGIVRIRGTTAQDRGSRFTTAPNMRLAEDLSRRRRVGWRRRDGGV
jgi:hypothetical protein